MKHNGHPNCTYWNGQVVNPPCVGSMEALDFFVICVHCNMKHCIALALQRCITCLTKEVI
jgi:hypothetical protein